MPHHWKYSRSGWTGFSATRSSCRYTCFLQGIGLDELYMVLKVFHSSNPKYSIILWLYVLLKISIDGGLNILQVICLPLNCYCNPNIPSESSLLQNTFSLRLTRMLKQLGCSFPFTKTLYVFENCDYTFSNPSFFKLLLYHSFKFLI